jgi:predicted RNA-binding protein with PIN domain
MLWAALPPGGEFGLGLACAVEEQRRGEREREDDDRARDERVAALEEARRRGDDVLAKVTAERDRLEDDLRVERGGRREREERARRDAESTSRRADESDKALAAAEAETTALKVRLEQVEASARAARKELGELRRTQRSARDEPGTELDVQALADAAATARKLAAALEAMVSASRRRQPDEGGDESRRNGARVRPAVPPGLVADPPAGLAATLSGGRVALVVDGYNVSMRGWSGASIADQRDRLVHALSALHARTRCPVTVVFDGADVDAPPPGRRAGVHVRFSAEGEEADTVVVRTVASLPSSQAVVVASSDRWVQHHAAAEGAEVVGADSLLGALRS